MNDLIKDVVAWADQKGILELGTPASQMEKTYEECDELKEAIYHQGLRLTHYISSDGKRKNTSDEIMDAIGDITVTLIIQAEMQGLDFQDCLQAAYDVISKRTGKMIDGQFVKDK